MSIYKLKDMIGYTPTASLSTSNYKARTRADRRKEDELERKKAKEEELDRLKKDFAEAKAANILAKDKSKFDSEIDSKFDSELSELDAKDKFIASKRKQAEKDKTDQDSLKVLKNQYDRAKASLRVKSSKDKLQSYQSGPEEVKKYNKAAADLKRLGGSLPQGTDIDAIIDEYEKREQQELMKQNVVSDTNVSKYDSYSSEEDRSDIASERVAAAADYEVSSEADLAAKRALADPFDTLSRPGKTRTDSDIQRELRSSPAAIAAKKKYNTAMSDEATAIENGDRPGALAARKTMIEADNEYYQATKGGSLKLESSGRYSSAELARTNSLKAAQEVKDNEMDLAAKKDKVLQAITDDVSKVAGDWMSANSKQVDFLANGDNFRKVFNSIKKSEKTPAGYAILAKSVNKMMEPTAGVMADDMQTVAAFGGDTGGKFDDMVSLSGQIAGAAGGLWDSFLKATGWTKEEAKNKSMADVMLELRKKGRAEQAKLYKDQWDKIVTTGETLATVQKAFATNLRAGIKETIRKSMNYAQFRNANALKGYGKGEVKDLFSSDAGKEAFEVAVNSKLNNAVRQSFSATPTVDTPPVDTPPVDDKPPVTPKEGERRESKKWPGFMEVVVDGKWIKDNKIPENKTNKPAVTRTKAVRK